MDKKIKGILEECGYTTYDLQTMNQHLENTRLYYPDNYSYMFTITQYFDYIKFDSDIFVQNILDDNPEIQHTINNYFHRVDIHIIPSYDGFNYYIDGTYIIGNRRDEYWNRDQSFDDFGSIYPAGQNRLG